jgi:hypothetical protein
VPRGERIQRAGLHLDGERAVRAQRLEHRKPRRVVELVGRDDAARVPAQAGPLGAAADEA